jgi:hypothetical protein
MVLRDVGDDGVVAIGQASHAWISGQLARAWGNARFPRPEPWEEVCLAAEQHDIGWIDWDRAPSLNPQTGRPRQFFELSRREHLALWTQAPGRLLTQSRHAALLVSLHGTGLVDRFPPRDPDEATARALEVYREGQRAFQRGLAADVGAADDELARHQALLAAWDDLSLSLCQAQPRPIRGVPAADGPVDLLVADAGDHYTLDPWPLSGDAATVVCEGVHLAGRHEEEAALHAALAAAPRVVLRFELRPATG